jgi:hypothetical protein
VVVCFLCISVGLRKMLRNNPCAKLSRNGIDCQALLVGRKGSVSRGKGPGGYQDPHVLTIRKGTFVRKTVSGVVTCYTLNAATR